MPAVSDRRACARRTIAAALDDAFRRTGFCYIAATGIDRALVEAAFDASRRFHALPAPAKQAIAINEFHRGYIAPKSSVIRSSSVARVTRPNLSESFMAMHEIDPDDDAFGRPLQGPNQWPAGLPGFRETVIAYRDAMSVFARRFNRLLALALDLPATFFDPHFERPTAWLRLVHYPPEPPATPPDQYGAAPHTDYGFITFLAQDGLGGLEVRTQDGGWIPAPPIPDTFVVNVADMLARWSNDRWTSTPHRVRNRSGRDRYSDPLLLGHGHGERDHVPADLHRPGQPAPPMSPSATATTCWSASTATTPTASDPRKADRLVHHTRLTP